MASNKDFVVPAGKNARRFCCLDTPDTSEGDPEYFARVFAATHDPVQLGAFLKYLLDRDLSAFDVRKFPKTAMLADQKAASLDPHETWLLRLLHIGYVQDHDVVAHYDSKGRSIAHVWAWSEWYPTRTLFNNYEVYAQARALRYQLNPVTFGKFMTQHFRAGKKSDVPGYHFGPLDQARAWFAEQHGLTGDVWGHDQAEIEPDEPKPAREHRAKKGDSGAKRGDFGLFSNGSGGGRKARPPCDQPGCEHLSCSTGPGGNWCGDHLELRQREGR